jgi:hypothetical protein
MANLPMGLFATFLTLLTVAFAAFFIGRVIFFTKLPKP